MLQACSDGSLVDEFHKIDSSVWTYEDSVTDSFNIEKTHFYHQIFANIRINSDYEWENLYLKVTIENPEGIKTEKVESVKLAEKSGKWLGSGIGSTLTYQSPILGKMEFKKAGQYKITLSQNMRTESLQHVVSIGSKVIELEEIY